MTLFVISSADLPGGDTQDQVAEQDEDSDDVPGMIYRDDKWCVIMCYCCLLDLVENFDEASKSEM